MQSDLEAFGGGAIQNLNFKWLPFKCDGFVGFLCDETEESKQKKVIDDCITIFGLRETVC